LLKETKNPQLFQKTVKEIIEAGELHRILLGDTKQIEAKFSQETLADFQLEDSGILELLQQKLIGSEPCTFCQNS